MENYLFFPLAMNVIFANISLDIQTVRSCAITFESAVFNPNISF